MTVEIFTPAEGASIKEGQLCILHTYNNVFVSGFPAPFQTIIVGQIRFRVNEEGAHNQRVVLRHPDGRELYAGLNRPLFVRPGPVTRETTFFNFIEVVQAEVFEEGNYEVALIVDGETVMATPLGISQLKTKA